MEFHLVASIETFTNIALQGFEGQVRIIHLLGPSHDRVQHIENLKKMLDFLKQSIEADRDKLIETLEEIYSEIADELAEKQTLLDQAATTSNDAEIKKYSRELAQAQPKIIKNLGAQETSTEKRILQKFKILLESVEEMRTRVENIRV